MSFYGSYCPNVIVLGLVRVPGAVNIHYFV